jgi:hypothetical protein
MVDCGLPIPCESSVSAPEQTALSITNQGTNGTAIRARAAQIRSRLTEKSLITRCSDASTLGESAATGDLPVYRHTEQPRV